MKSINEPSADALDILLYHWGEFPELELHTNGEADAGYFLFRELEKAGYLNISRASNFSHKVWPTKKGRALASMLPPLDETRREHFVGLYANSNAKLRRLVRMRP